MPAVVQQLCVGLAVYQFEINYLEKVLQSLTTHRKLAFAAEWLPLQLDAVLQAIAKKSVFVL